MNTKSWAFEFNTFKNYIWDNRWYIAVYTGIFFLIYGAWLFNISPHIDAEVFINSPYSTYNWLQVGRQGLVLTGFLWGIQWFNPFFSMSFGFAILWGSGLLFGYLLWRMIRVHSYMTTAFGLLCFVSPIMVEQLYFNLQLFQLAWAYCLCALGVGFSYYGILNKSTAIKVIAVLCMIWSFSSYQIFCILHVATVVACFRSCVRWQWTWRWRRSRGRRSWSRR